MGQSSSHPLSSCCSGSAAEGAAAPSKNEGVAPAVPAAAEEKKGGGGENTGAQLSADVLPPLEPPPADPEAMQPRLVPGESFAVDLALGHVKVILTPRCIFH